MTPKRQALNGQSPEAKADGKIIFPFAFPSPLCFVQVEAVRQNTKPPLCPWLGLPLVRIIALIPTQTLQVTGPQRTLAGFPGQGV